MLKKYIMCLYLHKDAGILLQGMWLYQSPFAFFKVLCKYPLIAFTVPVLTLWPSRIALGALQSWQSDSSKSKGRLIVSYFACLEIGSLSPPIDSLLKALFSVICLSVEL